MVNLRKKKNKEITEKLFQWDDDVRCNDFQFIVKRLSFPLRASEIKGYWLQKLKLLIYLFLCRLKRCIKSFMNIRNFIGEDIM